ncbi:MAG: hypothetical protein IKQ44_11325 [Lachnospiraceae bacterium]|nr:hypothetical protein [Lachnospiraceae bacterium]
MSKQSETITFIPIEKIIPFRDHPFQIRDDEQMKMMKRNKQRISAKKYKIANVR